MARTKIAVRQEFCLSFQQSSSRSYNEANCFTQINNSQDIPMENLTDNHQITHPVQSSVPTGHIVNTNRDLSLVPTSITDSELPKKTNIIVFGLVFVLAVKTVFSIVTTDIHNVNLKMSTSLEEKLDITSDHLKEQIDNIQITKSELLKKYLEIDSELIKMYVTMGSNRLESLVESNSDLFNHLVAVNSKLLKLLKEI
ncbi:hypothetical protein Btru_066964 [Bulinus truncatus]|nr:hypothetical protein Btru_066964 [Bulinus truncatus]